MGEAASCMEWRPDKDGNLIACGEDGGICLLEVNADAGQAAQIRKVQDLAINRHPSQLGVRTQALDWNPKNGDHIAVVTSTRESPWILDVAKGKTVQEAKNMNEWQSHDLCWLSGDQAVFGGGEFTLATACSDESVRVYDARISLHNPSVCVSVRNIESGHKSSGLDVSCCEALVGGGVLGGTVDGSLYLWDLRQPTKVLTCYQYNSGICSLASNKDSTTFAVSSFDGSACVGHVDSAADISETLRVEELEIPLEMHAEVISTLDMGSAAESSIALLTGSWDGLVHFSSLAPFHRRARL
uniref:Anaphase-promoting complex subunit 4 WD40 domain-containing protein n=1 Tax=Erythrolobus madagascarensis TaxID=708628 RepID=A0A7S0T952_9RHOD